jgi:hypothetical protein
MIAVSLVLGLVVGAYSFAVFGSNVKTIQLTSANLGAGPATTTSAAGAYFQLIFNNPGSKTNVSSVSLSSGAQAVRLSFFTCPSQVSCNSLSGAQALADAFVIDSEAGSSMTVYFGTPLSFGAVYTYVITITNGQSITGSQIAQ